VYVEEGIDRLSKKGRWEIVDFNCSGNTLIVTLGLIHY
jgi:hypothetical protein